VIAQAGVTKGSMYHHFPSKEALIAAYLYGEADSWLSSMRALDLQNSAPADRVALLFSAVADQVDAGTFSGCPFTNAAIECPDMPGVQIAITRYRRMLQDHIEVLLAGVGSDPLTATVTVIYDGALTSAKLGATAGRIREIAEFVRTLVSSQP